MVTLGPIVLEVLAGARDEQHAHDLRRLLDRCSFVPLEEPSDWELAAALHRACRRAGTTVGRLPDCLIAVLAMRVGADLLHQNADFDAIAQHAPWQSSGWRSVRSTWSASSARPPLPPTQRL